MISWGVVATAMALVAGVTSFYLLRLALPLFLAGVAFAWSAGAGPLVLVMLALSTPTLGIYAAIGTFWSLPTSIPSGTGAAAGLALINSIGNWGFVGPFARPAEGHHGRLDGCGIAPRPFARLGWSARALFQLCGTAVCATSVGYRPDSSRFYNNLQGWLHLTSSSRHAKLCNRLHLYLK